MRSLLVVLTAAKGDKEGGQGSSSSLLLQTHLSGQGELIPGAALQVSLLCGWLHVDGAGFKMVCSWTDGAVRWLVD